MKKEKITISKEQFDFISEILEKHCLARAIDKTFEYVYKKEVREIKHAYCSIQYNTIEAVVMSIYNNNTKRLNII